MNSIAKWVCGF